MAKNKGTYRSQREPEAEVDEALDAAVAQQTVSFFTQHRNKVFAAIGLVVVAIGVVGMWRWRDRNRDAAATGLYQRALVTLAAPITATPTAQVTLPGEAPELTFPTAEARNTAALALLDQIDRDYAKTRADHSVALMRAGVLYDLGRFADAEKVYRALAADTTLPDVLRLLAREGLGRTLETKAMTEKDDTARTAGLTAALAEYKQLQPDPAGLHHDAAVYNQARIMVLTGDIAGAKAAFKSIVETMPASPFVSDATERLAALE